MIPVARPRLNEEEIEAACRVMRSGSLASGPEVDLFQKEFASYVGTECAVATNSGTSALHTALTAIGIKPGDEVIVPSFSFVATATSVSMCGAKPVFADVDEKTFCIDPYSVPELITPQTRAITGVHLFGQPFDLIQIREICDDHRLLLVEDAAQAHGSRYNGKMTGSLGDIGCFSFYPTKNMTTGEGGIITTNNHEYAERAGRFINHGQSQKYLHTELGFNYRMPDIFAAIGRVQLKRLDEMNKKRQENAGYYSSHLKNNALILPYTKAGCTHVYHQYVIRIPKSPDITRDTFAEDLRSNGIGTAVHYPIPIHKQPLYAEAGSHCPVSEKISGEVLSLPVYPELPHEEREYICKTINGA